jgi:predicted MFS family arabinose efflux permease
MPPRLTGLWRHPDFLKLWLGQTISEIGSHITREGVPLTAVIVLGAAPFPMGVLASLSGISTLVFGPIAGLWVDRHRRRPILVAADLGRAVVLATVPLAAAFGALHMRQLYVVAALTGILTVFFDVAYQSYLPSLVERERVLEGNSKLALGSSMAEIAGPGLTGMLVQLITAPIAILVDALSFVWSALMVWLIRKPEPIPALRAEPRIWHELAGGLRTVAGHPVQRAIARQAATGNFFIGFFLSLYVLYAIRYLRISPAVLGVVIAVGGASNMLGALLAWRLARRFGVGSILIGSMLLIGVAALMIPLAHGSVVMATVFLVAAQLGDLGWPIYNINELTLRQAITPKGMLGRVNAVMQMLIRGVFPVGSFCGGVLASVIGVRPTLTLGALGFLSSSLWLIFSPIRKLREYPTAAVAT